MDKKRIIKHRRKTAPKNKNIKSEKIVSQVYACIIICAMAFALSKWEGDYGKLLRQKIKVAINESISFEEAGGVISAWSEKINGIELELPFTEFSEEL